MSTKKKKYVDICDDGTYNDTNGTQERRKTNGGQREKSPTLDTVEQLAKGLHLKVTDLFESDIQ